MMNAPPPLLAAALAAAVAAAPLAAQVNPEPEAPAAAEAQALQRRAAKAAEQAANARPAEDSEVSYEQVLASPDDPALNLRFVKGQVRAGNLRTAASSPRSPREPSPAPTPRKRVA